MIRALVTTLLATIAMPVHAGETVASTICGTCRVERVASCPGRFLEGVNVDGEGGVWALGLTDGAILRVSGGRCEVAGKTGGLANGARFAADGRLIVTDLRRGLLAFDPRSGTVSVVAAEFDGKPFAGLNDLYPDGRGGFFFTDPGRSDALHPTGRVFHIALGGEPKVTQIAQGIAFPNGVAVSPDGQMIYVSEFARQQLLSMPSPTFKGVVGMALVMSRLDGGHPDGIVVDKDGRIYVAAFGVGAVQVFEPSGKSLGLIPLPKEAGAMTTNMAIADGFLYITEAEKGGIWRVRLK